MDHFAYFFWKIDSVASLIAGVIFGILIGMDDNYREKISFFPDLFSSIFLLKNF